MLNLNGKPKLVIMITMLFVSTMLSTACDQLGGGVDDEGHLVFTAENIRIPDGFGLWPTGVSKNESIISNMVEDLDIGQIAADALGSECEDFDAGFTDIEVCIDDVISATGIEDAVAEEIAGITELEDMAFAAIKDKLRFTPKINIGETINSILGATVKEFGIADFSKIDLTFDITNNAPVPIRFAISFGTQDAVEDGSALIDVEGENYTVDLAPGETKTVEVENADEIKDALNDIGNIATSYRATIIANELNASALDWLINASPADANANGIPDAIESFDLELSNFIFDVEVTSEFSIFDDIPIPDSVKDYIAGIGGPSVSSNE